MSLLNLYSTPADRARGEQCNPFEECLMSYHPWPPSNMGPKPKNLIGKTFGELLVLGADEYYISPSGHKHLQWKCLCSCGQVCTTRGTAMTSGKARSCGHLINGRKDIKNQRFGKLVAVRDTGQSTKHGKAIWECQCDCGNITTATANILNRGEKKSCGCLSRTEHPAAKDLFRGYRKNAEQRGHAFDLSFDKFCETIQMDCFYCGIPMSNIRKPRHNYGEDFPYNGIDRVDNTKGYILDNCVPCCQTCNIAKMTSSVQEFYNWIEVVYLNCKNKGIYDESS